MTLDTLKSTNHVIGIKQVTKALKRGQAKKIFIAADAEARVTEPLVKIANARKVLTETLSTMKELGAACGIEVGAAAVAVLED